MKRTRNSYEKIFMVKKNSKKILMTVGICFLTGSFCACGDDTELVLSEVVAQAQSETALQENNQGADAMQSSETPQQSTLTAEVTSTPTPQPDTISITISAAGDVTLGNYPEQPYEWSLPQMYDQQQNDAYFFENVYDIFSEDDLTLVNLEGVLTTAETRREGVTYNIKGKPEYVNILTEGSIEAVSMANNHRRDYLEQGSDDTVALLQEAGIAYAYDNNVAICEVGDIRIGYVSVNEIAWKEGVEKLIEQGIVKLQEEQADLIFVCCHWGIEREYYPEEYQQILGRKCIDWGADLVIGHHPHVLQGIEEYQGKFIVYSLGNFCFGANRNPADKDTMIFQQTFTFVEGEKQEDQNIRVIPCSISSVTNRNDYKPTPAAGEEADRIIDKINDCSKDFGVKFDEDGLLVKEKN